MQCDPSMLISNLHYPYINDIAEYEKLTKVGQGTFGEVFKARHRKTNKVYALKKFMPDKETNGLPVTSLREIKILQIVNHENLLTLKDICVNKGSGENNYKSSLYLVLEYCEHDLAGLLSNFKVVFSLGEIKMILHMMFNALYYLHYNQIIHRDLKSSNILVTREGVLKLADFGLARYMRKSLSDPQPNPKLTNRVVTLWYRAPELLLGSVNYTYSIDMWAAGCIMSELWTRVPLLQGNNEIVQLQLIQVLCGSIRQSEWPKVTELSLYNQLELTKGIRRCVTERLSPYIASKDALDVIDKLLVYDPDKRLDADAVLNHDFFWSDPMPTSVKELISSLTFSNYDMFSSRNEKREPIIKIPPGFISRFTPNQNRHVSNNYRVNNYHHRNHSTFHPYQPYPSSNVNRHSNRPSHSKSSSNINQPRNNTSISTKIHYDNNNSNNSYTAAGVTSNQSSTSSSSTSNHKSKNSKFNGQTYWI